MCINGDFSKGEANKGVVKVTQTHKSLRLYSTSSKVVETFSENIDLLPIS